MKWLLEGRFPATRLEGLQTIGLAVGLFLLIDLGAPIVDNMSPGALRTVVVIACLPIPLILLILLVYGFAVTINPTQREAHRNWEEAGRRAGQLIRGKLRALVLAILGLAAGALILALLSGPNSYSDCAAAAAKEGRSDLGVRLLLAECARNFPKTVYEELGIPPPNRSIYERLGIPPPPKDSQAR